MTVSGRILTGAEFVLYEVPVRGAGAACYPYGRLFHGPRFIHAE
ncbi:hypothetical protein N9I60_00965 [Planktomarina temperata]|nr:hypothetical protein [Planktomarina temperata]MDB4091417.1 hypothetical protein [bacterium]MDB9880768.1 hypothetical protein [Planktomarina temperata]